MSQLTISDAAEAAAKWWAEQIGAPSFRNTNQSDSPSDQLTGFFAGVMAADIAEKHPVTDEQETNFVRLLAAKIEDRLRSNEKYGVYLSVDYGPCAELAEVAELAGVSKSRFPWKTTMDVQHDHVVASLGYGAPLCLIWAADTWERGICGHHVWTDSGEPTDQVCNRERYHDGVHGDFINDETLCGGCGLTYAGHHALRPEWNTVGFHVFGQKLEDKR